MVYIETYRGYDIYFLGHLGLQLYGVVDPSGNELNMFYSTLAGIRGYIDSIAQTIVDTILTINAPPVFYLEESFVVNGFLRDVGGNPIGGLPVKLFVDDTLLSQMNTQSDGSYAFTLALSEPGDHTLTACYGCVSASLRLGKP